MLRLQRIKRTHRTISITNTDAETSSSTRNLQKVLTVSDYVSAQHMKNPKSPENNELKKNMNCNYKSRSDLTPEQLTARRKKDAIMKRIKRASETDIERAIRRAKVAQRARERRQKEGHYMLKKAGLKFFMRLAERTDLKRDPNLQDPLAFTNEIQKETDIHDPSSEQNSCSLLKDVTIITIKNDSTLVPIIKEEIIKEVESTQREEKSPYPVDENFDDVCSIQDDSYEDTRSTEKHFVVRKEKIKSVSKSLPHKCTICSKVLTTKGNMKMHMAKRHGVKRSFKCKICDASFDFLRQVVRHRDVHRRASDNMFQCDKCGKVTLEHHNFLTHLKVHMKPNLRNIIKQFVCELCGNIFKRSDGLKNHKLLIHHVDGGTKAEKYKQKHCVKNHVCNTCGKRFAFKCLLQDHMNIHSGLKPYLCSKCGRSFTQKPSLKQHAKTHGMRSFKCTHCDNAFYNHGDLKKHVRTHTGERPYVCEVCGETYSQSSHLSVHRRSHTGERPFTCDICGRGFTKSSDVVRHRRIHTGELPYLCPVCGKGFRQSAQCANHIKIRHPDSTMIMS